MTEWKKAKKLIEWREPEPNTHEWKYAGRTPQGGLSGGDDVHECTLCGRSSLSERWNDQCWEGEKGKTEVIQIGPNYRHKERAILGKHIIIKDETGLEIILIENFKKYYEEVPKPDLICNVCGKSVYCTNRCPRCSGDACDDCFDVDTNSCSKCLQEQ